MMDPADYEVRKVLPATLAAAEEFFGEFRRRSQELMDRASSFAAELMVREALTNAVVHGSDTDPERQIRCSWRLKGERLLIVVRDDGDGFDWRRAWDHPSEFPACSGRGIEILRRYSRRVRFNDRGNTVTIIQQVLRKSQ